MAGELSRAQVLRAIQSFLVAADVDCFLLCFVGHGTKGSGDWVLSDGVIDLQDLLNAWHSSAQQRSAHSELVLFLDCCYSGQWVRRCEQLRDSLVSVTVQASTQPHVESFSGFIPAYLKYVDSKKDDKALVQFFGSAGQVPVAYRSSDRCDEEAPIVLINPSGAPAGPICCFLLRFYV